MAKRRKGVIRTTVKGKKRREPGEFKECINCGTEFKNRYGRTCTSTCAHAWFKRKQEWEEATKKTIKEHDNLLKKLAE